MNLDETPTLAQYITHAEKFGTEQVYETAETHLSGTELLQLDGELTRIDIEHKRTFRPIPKRKRMPMQRKARLVQFLTDEGLPTSRIAAQLGVGTRQVERIRQQHGANAQEATQPDTNA